MAVIDVAQICFLILEEVDHKPQNIGGESIPLVFYTGVAGFQYRIFSVLFLF